MYEILYTCVDIIRLQRQGLSAFQQVSYHPETRFFTEAFRRACRNQTVDKNMFPTLLKRAFDKLSSQPELAISGFLGAGLIPLDKSKPAKKIIGIDSEAPLDSPRKAILKVDQANLSPEVDPVITEAI